MRERERLHPSFFIIGERKCGTSSLFRYLVAHPHVLPGRLKEPNFFGAHSPAHIEAHLDDYLSLFPSADGGDQLVLTWPELDGDGVLYEEPVRFDRVPRRRYITGEASANSFQDVDPEVLHRHLPDLKLILLVRDPVERAYSHHRMYARFQAEGRQLGFEVGDFATDMRAEMAAARRGENPPCIGPGIYIERLPSWVEVWGWPRLRVIRTEDLDDPDRCHAIMDDLQAYLGLPRWSYGDELAQRFNRAPPAAIPDAVRAELADFYAPHNRALEQYLGRPLAWS